jgi:hypothetical protein
MPNPNIRAISRQNPPGSAMGSTHTVSTTASVTKKAETPALRPATLRSQPRPVKNRQSRRSSSRVSFDVRRRRRLLCHTPKSSLTPATNAPISTGTGLSASCHDPDDHTAIPP